MDSLINVCQYFINLGNYIFMPILMCCIGLIFGLKLSKAIKSGAMMGIGLVGISIVMTLISDTLGPVIQDVIQKFGLNLIALDVGASLIASVGYGSLIGVTLVVAVIAMNIVLVALKLTNTVNVDVYNFGCLAVTAGIVYLLTGSFLLGVLAGLTHAILCLKVADILAHRTQQVIGLEAISIPHPFAAGSAPVFMVLDKIYDKIPFFAHKKAEEKEEALNEKGILHTIGRVLGDRIYLGLIMGLFFGVCAGYDFKGIADVTIKTAAMMELFPMVVKMLVNALVPISNAAKQFFMKHFSDRKLYIGLDSAITVGHPVTISVGFLLIPAFLVIAAILPGNITLPLGELPFAAFYICMATIVHRANKKRVIASGLIFIPIVLWIASWGAPFFNQMALDAGFKLVADGQLATTMAIGNIFTFFPTLLACIPGVGAVALILLDILAIFGGKFLEKRYIKEDKKFESLYGIESESC